MARGTVKWFSNAKGYGFICSSETSEDIFAHYSAISMDGYKTLKQGQEVLFDLNEGPKGFQAVNIRLQSDSAVSPPTEQNRAEEVNKESTDQSIAVAS